MNKMNFLILIIYLCGCQEKRVLSEYGLLMRFKNSDNIFYFLPIQKGSGNCILDVSRTKIGYQFYSSSQAFHKAVKSNTFFQKELINIFNEDKEIIYLNPIELDIGYTISETYKKEKVKISQENLFLDFDCSYIDKISINNFKLLEQCK